MQYLVTIIVFKLLILKTYHMKFLLIKTAQDLFGYSISKFQIFLFYASVLTLAILAFAIPGIF